MMEEKATQEGPGYSLDEMLDKVYKVLSRTTNSLALGPDRISYRIVKAANKPRLGEELMIWVAANLVIGSIPKDWQNSKVVFIPKPEKDHTELRAWRPITRIKCIGKLGGQVVAVELQAGDLLYKLQFGSMKNRSVIDTVFREVARVQKYLARKGKAG